MPILTKSISIDRERKLAIAGLKADLDKLRTLLTEAYYDEDIRNEYWDEIVNETCLLKYRVIHRYQR